MRRVMGREILECVAEKSGIPVEEIRSSCRSLPIADARALASYLMIRHCRWLSYSHVSRILECHDVTARHAYRRFPALMAENPDLEFVHDEVVSALGLSGGVDRGARGRVLRSSADVVRLPHKGRAK